MNIRVLSERYEVKPYVESVRQAADAEKSAFGFLPASAYDDFAYQGRMLVAVEPPTNELVGYLLFGGAMPQGRIFQVWADPRVRGNRVGHLLVSRLVRLLEDQNFLSIRADVAQDLDVANSFYGSLDFDVIRVRQGGKARGRKVNIRVRELSTPSLLELADDRHRELGGLTTGHPATRKVPLYVLDLNVVFDITKQRVQSEISSSVMASAFENEIRLAVTTELIRELEKYTSIGRPDPVLSFVKTLPRLPAPPKLNGLSYIDELSNVIFSKNADSGRLRPQDYSDLIHLATAIHQCAAGFITSEKAILSAAGYTRLRYGLDILSPQAFLPSMVLDSECQTEAMSGVSRIQVRPIRASDHVDLEEFLARMLVDANESRLMLSSGTSTRPRKRFAVRADDRVVAIASWDAGGIGAAIRDLHICVDERDLMAPVFADHLISRAISDVSVSAPSVLQIKPRSGQFVLRRAAVANGFLRVDGHSPRASALRKIAAGRVLIPDGWLSFRESFRQCSGIDLPLEMPSYISGSQVLIFEDASKKEIRLSLSEVENLFSPLLFVLNGRPAVILPIRRTYAEALFRGSDQLDFLSDYEALLHSARWYISGPGSYSIIRDGCIAVFYESGRGGGRAAAIAVARITRRYLMDKDTATAESIHKAVLAPGTIQAVGRGGHVTVSEFDNLTLFSKPVPLARLRMIGCADGANFVTTRSLASEHLISILKVGLSHA